MSKRANLLATLALAITYLTLTLVFMDEKAGRIAVTVGFVAGLAILAFLRRGVKA